MKIRSILLAVTFWLVCLVATGIIVPEVTENHLQSAAISAVLGVIATALSFIVFVISELISNE
jgi:hypothetical protein